VSNCVAQAPAACRPSPVLDVGAARARTRDPGGRAPPRSRRHARPRRPRDERLEKCEWARRARRGRREAARSARSTRGAPRVVVPPEIDVGGARARRNAGFGRALRAARRSLRNARPRGETGSARPAKPHACREAAGDGKRWWPRRRRSCRANETFGVRLVAAADLASKAEISQMQLVDSRSTLRRWPLYPP
jgi:hypothetical protein